MESLATSTNVTTFMKSEVIEKKKIYVALKIVIARINIYDYLNFQFASRTKVTQRIFWYLRHYGSRPNLDPFGACANILAKI